MSTAKAKNTDKAKAKDKFAITKTVRTISENCRNTVREYNEKYAKTFIDTGREFGENMKKTGTDLKSGLKNSAGELGKTVKTDARKVMDRVVETAKTSMPGIPAIKTARQKVKDGFNAVSERINLPSKSDMEKLNQAMETLGGKVKMFAGKYAA